MENLKSKSVLLLLVIPIAFLVYFGIKEAGTYYYENFSSLKPSTVYLDNMKNQVIASEDPYKIGRLGMIFLKNGYLDLALDSFGRATTLDPKWRDAFIWKGYTELNLKKPQEALSSLRQAENLDPTYAFTYDLLSKTYAALGNDTEAKAAKEKLAVLNK